MAQKSHYPRIVVVKSFNPDCLDQLKTQIGKYTHIQSYNGVLLDGLDISTVSSIIQASHLNKIQLVVRYIHPITNLTNTDGLTTGITTLTTPSTPAERMDQPKETLPIQLTILGNVLTQRKELFRHLSTPFDSGSSVQFTMNRSSIDSTPTKGSETYLRVPSQTAKSETSGSGCDSYESSDFSNDYAALSWSDKYVHRAFVPPELFSNSSSTTTTSNLTSPVTPARASNSDKQYIITMFTHEMDRRFVHLFLRQSGIYIVTVSLSAMIDDPQIQFENLLYWIRLVQGYVEPYGIKRIIIVGMKDTPLNTDKELTCLDNLRGAILEAEYHNVYKNHGSPIVLFDPDKVRSSLNVLCQAISRCMELMMSRAWYMDRPFFKNVFQPFTSLNRVLCNLVFSKDITMSADSMLSISKNTDPNYFDVLASFSTAAISLMQNCKYLVDLCKMY